ncbi:uncharacterized protein LOC120167762 [Hibiscus syriacus]|uniref:uncharacterized protein LOC120167762 n=1 Tax=Hibiscus syriacus TaxID=106335 RepID=UPI001920B41A|nr:uncharacterized protein LOC120167762 [Hibiscus syriacus]
MQRITNTLWTSAIQGSRVQVSKAGRNTFIFSFNNETARNWVLDNGPWHILNKPMILRKWEPNLTRLNFDLSKIPVWVKLFNVPLELYTITGLSYLASAIGNPISLDSITASKTRLEYARICVEIGITDEIPKFVNVILKDGRSTSISVEVPWLPLRCKNCKVFGHSEKNCFSNAAPVKTQVWIKKRALETSTSCQNEALQDPIEHTTMVQNAPVLNVTTPIVEEIHTDVVQKASDPVADPKHEGIQDIHFPDLKVSAITNEPTALDVTGNNSSTTKNREKGRPVKDNSKSVLAGSKNKFDILNSIDEHSSVTEDQTRKIRTASLGVSALLNDLKNKKKQHLEKARSSTVAGYGGAPSFHAQ